MKLSNSLIINFVKWQRILLPYAQNAIARRSRSGKERHQNIGVTTVATNFMILKQGLSIQRKNRKRTLADDTPILMNKLSLEFFLFQVLMTSLKGNIIIRSLYGRYQYEVAM